MSRHPMIVALIGAGFAAAPHAQAQCQLIDPSFELFGVGESSWGFIGDASAATLLAEHGQVAARVAGADTGALNVSAFGQALSTVAGERWRVRLHVGHSSSEPLTGDTLAFVNIEWLDANEQSISFDSYTVADAQTPTDVMQAVAFESNPAPAGAAYAILILGVLQPSNAPGAAYFDAVEFNRLTFPTIDDIQWNDFPGGRTLEFGGHTWRVKGPGFYGPGSSLFSDSPSHVWVDVQERLHMTIKRSGSAWYSSEVTIEEPLGYGDYLFTVVDRPDLWTHNVVLGLFLWQYPVCWEAANPWNLHNEFDIELSRWNNPDNSLGQFVTQPWSYPGNISRYDMDFSSGGPTTHAFRWLPDRIESRAWYGGPTDEDPATLVHTWTYTGPHIPRPEQPRVHINFWQLNGPPANGANHEAIIEQFVFVPSCAGEASTLRCFVTCLDGPDTAITQSCATFDADGDDDSDLHDLVVYQQGFASGR